MPIPIVNNFRRLNLSYDRKPQHLVQFDKYEEFIIYRSNFDSKEYIIFNPNDETYYPFEDQGSENVKNALKVNIQTYFLKQA